MIRSMAENPIIFAMANPDPEITPEEVARDPHRRHHGDRPLRLSEPGQQRARLPLHLPRRARRPRHHHQRRDEGRRRRSAGRSSPARTCPTTSPPPIRATARNSARNYIIPVPFDPRLISAIPVAVAKAAMDSGVARRPILDLDKYAQELSARRDPIASTLQRIYDRVRRQPKRVVFAEGEEEQVMRAAVSYANQRLGTAILVGREEHRQGERRAMPASTSTGRASRSSTPACRAATPSMPTISTSACSARASCSATASA